MVKKIIGVVLIVLAGAAWCYLDYQNKQAIQAAEELKRSIAESRAQAMAKAKAAAEIKAKFEAQILADLSSCKAAAEIAKSEFITKNQVPVRRKAGQFTIPQAVSDEASKTLEAADATCQTTYDTRLKNGS